MVKTRSKARLLTKTKTANNSWSPGTYVWGCMNKIYWPGIIVSHKELNFKAASANKSWIFWFGDYRVSLIRHVDVCLFFSNFQELYKQKRRSRICSNTWLKGVTEAVREHGLPETLNYDFQQLMEYATSNMGRDKGPISTFVLDKLHAIRDRNSDQESDSEEKIGASDETKVLLKSMLDGTRNFRDVCLGCYGTHIVGEHPLFEGCVCAECKERIKRTYNVIGDDDIKYNCAICGCLGNMVVCSTRGCRLVYCSTCLNDLCLPRTRQHILGQDPWYCFICDTDSANGLVKGRRDWKQREQELFCDFNPLVPRPTIPDIKKPIRVLSLFDGIGTGLHALMKLNIKVERYYSCEIDEIAISVVKKNYPGGIDLLGDVRTLTEETIKSILPIDLLIGGSPCNDLSLANPYRRGLYDSEGTGALFFEFFRILTNLQMHNPRQFFWFYENVSSMTVQSRVSISRFLQCEPQLIDAAWVSSQTRQRYFWGNLLTLRDQRFIIDEGPDLQHYLIPGRKAAVKKLRTVTTKSNSLKQGSPPIEQPILEGINIDILELEEIFGFPRNYTKVGDLSVANRQKLLGKAWSVQVVCMLLRCLRDYFEEESVTAGSPL